MRILIDMDQVLANFDKRVLDTFRLHYPNKPYISLEDKITFYIKDAFPEENQEFIQEIYLTKGFYASLQPIKGSLEALAEIAKSEHESFICTSPLLQNPYCIQEKFEWIEKYFGKAWTKRTIVTKDKTIVQGDYLIDDKAEITGVQQPTWEHIIYTQPHNTHIPSKRRLTWNNWKTILNL